MSAIINNVEINAGVHGFVSIEDSAKKVLYKKDVSSLRDAMDFLEKYGKPTQTPSLLEATIVPISGSNWQDTCKNVCIPTVSRALKVNNFFLKLFGSLLAVPLDLLTLLPRICMAVCGKSTSLTLPLTDLLPEKLVANDELTIRVDVKNTVFSSTPAEHHAVVSSVEGYTKIALKALKGKVLDQKIYVSDRDYMQLSTADMMKDDWNMMNSVSGDPYTNLQEARSAVKMNKDLHRSQGTSLKNWSADL